MVQVRLTTTTNYDGELNALVEDLGSALTVNFSLDEPAPSGGLKVYVDSDIEQIVNRLNLPGFGGNPIVENINPSSVGTNFDNSGFFATIDEGATEASFTIDVFDNSEPDTFLPETFDGLVEAVFHLKTQDQVAAEDLADVGNLSDYTIDSNAPTSSVLFADSESQLTEQPPEPTPTPTPEPSDGVVKASLFAGPDYLIADRGTVGALAILLTDGVIPSSGFVVSVDAPNLSAFDLESISVQGGEIVAVRDGGFDVLMTEYTALLDLPVAADGDTVTGETANFSLAAGDGYEIVEEYSSGSFNLVDTREDIPQGVITEPNDIATVATDTGITLENPSFSGSDAIYFNIGNRYLNPDGTYTYISYQEDVDLYKVELSAEDTIAIETFEGEGNNPAFQLGFYPGLAVFDADGNRLEFAYDFALAAPDKLFGGGGAFNEDGTVNENTTDSYLEFTAPRKGIYYVGVSGVESAGPISNGFEDTAYDIETPGSGDNSTYIYGNYEIEIDLLTQNNPRQTGSPTPPVSNPNITNPPTLSLSASPLTVTTEGEITNAVVEFVETDDDHSFVTFTIRADGKIPEGGIDFVLDSNVNLFDYVSAGGQGSLPSTIGGQSLGAFYNEDSVPTGIRLRIEEPTMSVTLDRTTPFASFWRDAWGFGSYIDEIEGLETDGAEDVTFFLRTGEGYEIAPDAETIEVTYYDSLEDVPVDTGGDSVPEVGLTISESELIESEQNETILTFTLSEPPPAEGLSVLVTSEDDPAVGSALSQFDVLEAEVEGGNFPVPSGSSGFFFTILEQTARITLTAFDELSADLAFPPDTFNEGILGLSFTVQPQPGYTIDEDASEINLTIADNPDSQIQVSLTGSTEGDAESTTLIESEGTVSVHTFSLSAPPPEGGLTVNVSTDALADFDLDAIGVVGGTISNLSDDGFDLTITEREATISLPVLDDGTSESIETAIFTLEAGDNYEVNLAATGATFSVVETADQVVGVSEEIEGNEGNDTITQANALGLSANNSMVSISVI